MKVGISSEVLAAIRAHTAADPAREVCGLLFGTAEHIDGVMAARNMAADPARHFEIDPAALFAAIRAERGGGPKLAGYYHSHPHGPATPSATDRASAAPDGKLWLIVTRDAVTGWRAGPDGFAAVAIG
jgi:proteasome lid subunit RPN8/RPN11